MEYSFSTLESFPRIISILFSILMICGLFSFGEFLNKIFLKKNYEYLNSYAFNFIFSLAFFLLISFPLFLFFKIDVIFLKSFAYLFILFGIFFLGQKLIELKSKFIISNFKFSLFNLENFYYVLCFFLILSSFSAFLEIDSISYHLPNSTYILNNGTYPKVDNFNFLNYLSGNQDLLNALGLSINALEFFNLINSVSIILISSYFLNERKKDYFCCLLVFAPIYLIPIITSTKPFLISILFIFFIFGTVLRAILNKNNFIYNEKIIIIFSLILFCASLSKFSFVASSGLVFMYYFYYLSDNKKIIKNFCLIFATFIITYLPYLIWKYFNFEFSDIFETVIKPFPITDNHGNNTLFSYLRIYRDNTFYFPFYLFIPDNFSGISRIIGPSIFIIFLLSYSEKKLYPFFIVILLLTITHFFYGQQSARFYLEHYFYIIMILYFSNLDEKRIKLKKILSIGSSLLILPILLYQIFFFSLPSINEITRKKLYEDYVIFYQISKNFEVIPNSKIASLQQGSFASNLNVDDLNNIIIWDLKTIEENLENLKKKNYDYLIFQKSNNLMTIKKKDFIVKNLEFYEFKKFNVFLKSRNPFGGKIENTVYIYKKKNKI